MRAKIYVPTTHPDSEDALQDIRKHLCDEYGGVTEYDAEGSWESSGGNVISETVKVVECVGMPSDVHTQTDIEHLAKTEVKQRLDQSEVLVTFEREIEEVII